MELAQKLKAKLQATSAAKASGVKLPSKPTTEGSQSTQVSKKPQPQQTKATPPSQNGGSKRKLQEAMSDEEEDENEDEDEDDDDEDDEDEEEDQEDSGDDVSEADGKTAAAAAAAGDDESDSGTKKTFEELGLVKQLCDGEEADSPVVVAGSPRCSPIPPPLLCDSMQRIEVGAPDRYSD